MSLTGEPCYPCSKCGFYHDGPVCPTVQSWPSYPATFPQLPTEQDEITKRLDRIIELLEALQPLKWQGGPK